MNRHPIAIVIGAALLGLSGACASTPAIAAPADERDAFITQYRAWLDQGRTSDRVIDFVRAHSPGWQHVDHLSGDPKPLTPGSRLLFTDRDRSALMVVIGSESLRDSGLRMLAAHIDTPAPRVSLTAAARNPKQTVLTATAHAYGGIRLHHWSHTPLALVGRVAVSGSREIPIALGLDADDGFAFYATDGNRKAGTLTVILASIPPSKHKGKGKGKGKSKSVGMGESMAKRAGEPEPAPPRASADLLFTELQRRYGVERRHLTTAELYLVPQQPAREVGVDRALIGAHGQDDRSNSYISWRALRDLRGTPRATLMTWLVDREEEGSYHVAGATSQFLEAVVAYLARAQGLAATEANLGRIFDASVAVSADTPATLNPNWPEVHEENHAPIIGRGAVLFAHTGSEGKQGGNQTNAPLLRQLITSFQNAGQPLQYGTLGRVDEGGGGTIAKHLAHRGIDVIDIGVAGISLHSPMELFSKDDMLSAYRGFSVWLAAQ